MKNANKSPKISYSAIVRKKEKWSEISIRDRITTKVNYFFRLIDSIITSSFRTIEWQNDRQYQSPNLLDGCNERWPIWVVPVLQVCVGLCCWKSGNVAMRYPQFNKWMDAPCSVGLCLFVGIIIYIAAVTGEVSNRPKSGDEPRFTYSYGPSLALTFISFISCELTAVLAVQLYISRRRQIKPAVAPSPLHPPAADVDACPPSNGRPPRGFSDRLDLDSSPRRELQPLNDRRSGSNCSSPCVIALQSVKSLKRDSKSARGVTSSSSGRVTSADVNHGDSVTRHRHDVIGDYSPRVGRHDLFAPSRACVSLSNVRSIDDLDPFKRITPVWHLAAEWLTGDLLATRSTVSALTL